MELTALVARTEFQDEEELLDYLVENRAVSLPKLSSRTGLTIYELRNLLGNRAFRKRATERLSLQVISLQEEENLLRKIADEAMAGDQKLRDRVVAAEFLMRHAGLERARETKVDVDHGVRVSFDPIPSLPGGWRPPDPLAGVVGAPALASPQRDEPDDVLDVEYVGADDPEAAETVDES